MIFGCFFFLSFLNISSCYAKIWGGNKISASEVSPKWVKSKRCKRKKKKRERERAKVVNTKVQLRIASRLGKHDSFG